MRKKVDPCLHDQALEKIESLAAENRRIKDQNVALVRANAQLADERSRYATRCLEAEHDYDAAHEEISALKRERDELAVERNRLAAQQASCADDEITQVGGADEKWRIATQLRLADAMGSWVGDLVDAACERIKLGDTARMEQVSQRVQAALAERSKLSSQLAEIGGEELPVCK